MVDTGIANNNFKEMKIVSRLKILFFGLIIILLAILASTLIMKNNGVESISLLISLTAIFLFFFWLGGILVSRYLIKPLVEIKKASSAMAEGNLDIELNLGVNGEIGSIEKSMHKIAKSILVAQEFTRNIGSGNFDIDPLNEALDLDDRNSLFTALLDMRTQLMQVAEADSKRNWITQGMAEFSKILRSDDTDLKALANKVISNMVRYIDAQQGAIFILNQENTEELYLELMASYAYAELEQINKKVLINEADGFAEGLVGQSYLEKDTIYLTDLPDSYRHISSGLGTAKPACILLVPLELNGIQEGVIEIASLQPLDSHKIEFVERLSENIASVILTIKTNENTKTLLKESQELARRLTSQEQVLLKSYDKLRKSKKEIEDKNQLIETQKKEIEGALAEQTEKSEILEAQEEEMRMNMEELVTTQEKMMATQIELDGQLNAINKSSISKVEFSLEGNISYANPGFCHLVGLDSDEIIDKNHNFFTEESFSESAEYETFWNRLTKGEAQSGEYKIMTAQQEERWVNAVYSPVIDQSGDCKKIIMLAFDITEARNLLVETQSQAKILQTQEEELRQNMEELKLTQAELSRKSKAIIELKEEEAKNARLKAREIESKNQLITSSIQYAQNIQSAILPSAEYFSQVVQDYFVIYLPKDIVSGDFYWHSQIGDKLFFASVDCTGHGVPGAFMSIIGNTLLNEIVNVQKIMDPGQILQFLHAGVKTKLRQEESANSDGMDVAVCCIEYLEEDKVQIRFSGAKRPLYYLNGDGLQELRGDRQSIGGWQTEDTREFNTHFLELKRNDYLYLSTDGLVDNPNPERKKFGVKRFKGIISGYQGVPMLEQKEQILEELIAHQRDAEQRDDITVLGIQL